MDCAKVLKLTLLTLHSSNFPLPSVLTATAPTVCILMLPLILNGMLNTCLFIYFMVSLKVALVGLELKILLSLFPK